MLGGVLLLTALQTLLAGTTLPYATRTILFGLVVLVAVMALREQSDVIDEEPMMSDSLRRLCSRAGPARPRDRRRFGDRPRDRRPADRARRAASISATSPTSSSPTSRRASRAPARRKADVASEADVARLFADVEASLGGLDALVNNAGIAGPTGGVEEIAPAGLAAHASMSA